MKTIHFCQSVYSVFRLKKNNDFLSQKTLLFTVIFLIFFFFWLKIDPLLFQTFLLLSSCIKFLEVNIFFNWFCDFFWYFQLLLLFADFYKILQTFWLNFKCVMLLVMKTFKEHFEIFGLHKSSSNLFIRGNESNWIPEKIPPSRLALSM